MAVRKRKGKKKGAGTGNHHKHGGDAQVHRDKHSRINRCHSFAWSRGLWKKAAGEIARVCAVLSFIYISAAWALAYADGLRGIDIPYFISATCTTIGLGDISASNQLNRAFAVFILPFGLVIISFVISTAMAYANSRALKLPSDEILNPVVKSNDGKVSISERLKLVSETVEDKLGNNAVMILKMFAKYLVVLYVGIAFFMYHRKEQRLQDRDKDEEMTFIDCAFFATVLSTTVGYGHRIWPVTDDAKAFLIVYMFVSTFIIGSIIGDLSTLYLEQKENHITELLVESTTWVHKADLVHRGKIGEADYVLFKLQQLQLVDDICLRRLANRFSELDVEKNRLLTIGVHVPSAKQVEVMQGMVAAPGGSHAGMTLIECWQKARIGLIDKFPPPAITLPSMSEEHLLATTAGLKTLDKGLRAAVEKEGDPAGVNHESVRRSRSATLLGDYLAGGEMDPSNPGRPVRLSECHDFKWSRGLWWTAAMETGRLSAALLLAYCALGWFFMVFLEGTTDPVWGCYFLAATLSTVGFGDIAPTTQVTRGAAVFLIPLGLVIIGFLLSFATAYGKSRPPRFVGAASDSPEEVERRALFDALDENRDGKLEEHEVVAGAGILGTTPEAAKALFHELDTNLDGYLLPPPKRLLPWRLTVRGKTTIIAVKMYATVLVGALFFKWFSPESENLGLTWVDAFYFATVTSTSVGYGDIIPSTDGGRIFMVVYMLVSTVVVGQALSDIIDVYVNDVVGEGIVRTLIDSTTWVHSADVDKNGYLTEADYVLFKLQQLQKVDAFMLDMLIDRFEEVDENANGWLEVGIDVPGPVQVEAMQKVQARTGKSLVELWAEMQPELAEVLAQREASKAAKKEVVVSPSKVSPPKVSKQRHPPSSDPHGFAQRSNSSTPRSGGALSDRSRPGSKEKLIEARQQRLAEQRMGAPQRGKSPPAAKRTEML